MTSTIVHDGRTDAERAYDALRDGSAYAERFCAGYLAGQAIGQALLAGADADEMTSILEEMDGGEAEEEGEKPCPPVPVGMPLDRPYISFNERGIYWQIGATAVS